MILNDCPHTPKYPDLPAVPSYEEAFSHCTFVDDVPEVAEQRALTSADGTTTRIDRAYWNRCSEAERAAIVAHERAHPCIGMKVDCEGCADKVGGYYMRVWGYAPETIKICYTGLRVARDLGMGNIADNAAVGAAAAERALAGRGLLGASGETVFTRLAAERLARTRTTTPATGSTAGTGTAPTKPLSSPSPLAPEPSGTATQTEAPSVDASVKADTTSPQQTDIAGDVVSAVLGDAARPHAGKVLIAAGVAAIVAVVLVVIVRRASRS